MNGRPRVSSFPGRPVVGSPYDTSDVREVIARMKGPEEPTGLAPGDLQSGSIVIPTRLADRLSGFLEQLIDKHFTGPGHPETVKDPTMSHFGDSFESTKMWGD